MIYLESDQAKKGVLLLHLGWGCHIWAGVATCGLGLSHLGWGCHMWAGAALCSQPKQNSKEFVQRSERLFPTLQRLSLQTKRCEPLVVLSLFP